MATPTVPQSLPTPLDGAVEDGRHLLASYRRRRRLVASAGSTPRQSDSPAQDLDEVLAQFKQTPDTARPRARLAPQSAVTEADSASVIIELTRALSKAATQRDATVEKLDSENKALRARVAQLEKQLDELAFSFDAGLLCLDYQPSLLVNGAHKELALNQQLVTPPAGDDDTP